MLEELAVVVAVALRRFDLRRRLEIQDPLLAALIRVEAPRRPDRQDQVVAGAVGEIAEDRSADATAFVNEQHLVGDAIPIELALSHRLRRPHDAEDDVVVEVQRDASRDRVTVWFDRAGLRQAMAVEVVVGGLERDASHRFDLVRARRRCKVVEQRTAAGEALDTEQLLGVKGAVGGAVLGVALLRDAAAGDVVHRLLRVRPSLVGRPDCGLRSERLDLDPDPDVTVRRDHDVGLADDDPVTVLCAGSLDRDRAPANRAQDLEARLYGSRVWSGSQAPATVLRLSRSTTSRHVPLPSRAIRSWKPIRLKPTASWTDRLAAFSACTPAIRVQIPAASLAGIKASRRARPTPCPRALSAT